MTDTAQGGGEAGGGAARTPRTVPMAAIAGAIVLIGLVTFALYRRNSAPAGGAAPETAPAPAPDASDATAEGAPPGTMISATPPIRLTPEASILAERYRCICGCNDTLSLCTCKNPSGSEEMKTFLQSQVATRKTPAAIDQAMLERFGPACLLSNPAPPQTLPSHAGAPPPAKGARPR